MFIKGTKVYTKNGYQNIETLKVGDLVLNKKNQYSCIEDIKIIPNQQIWEIRTLCDKSFYTVSNCLFYASQIEETHYTDSKVKTVQSLNYDDLLVGFVHIAKYGELGCPHYVYDKVTSIVKTDIFEDVYVLKIKDNNTYIVSDRVIGGMD